jgi:alkaline phosphatase
MPDTSAWSKLPGYILFDGRPYINYNEKSLERVFMISDSFLRYAKQNRIKFEVDTLKVQSNIQQAKLNRKLFRFWATPDTKDMWQQLVRWEVDLISTDNVDELSNFLAGLQ